MSTLIQDVVVSTTSGQLRGAWSQGVASFKGVPFAAPPFGPNRFQPPQPTEPWNGVRDALAYGHISPQTPYPPPTDALLGDQGVWGKDCLNLNVWTRNPSTGARMPVMVWIPGGAFARGAGSLPMYEGTNFARDGVVCVTVNYRLGADGFLYFDDEISNRGLLDQMAALRWVRENIKHFGGDPENVTVFGESAGAFSIGALLAMPSAEGLFGRAILQSGGAHHSISVETARKVTGNLATSLGIEPTAAAFAAVPIEQLLLEQAKVANEMLLKPDPNRWGEAVLNGMLFEPIVDGETLPGRPIERIRAGASRNVQVMTGNTSEEWRFFTVPLGLLDVLREEQAMAYVGRYGVDPKDAMSVYRANRPAASPGELYAAAVTDWFFRIPAVRLAETVAEAGRPTFLYEFTWRSPMYGGKLGACHALEIGFVFDNLAVSGPMAGENPPQPLADAMHKAWVAFARTGDPGWPAYSDKQRLVMRYNETGGAVVPDPASDERRFWDGIR